MGHKNVYSASRAKNNFVFFGPQKLNFTFVSGCFAKVSNCLVVLRQFLCEYIKCGKRCLSTAQHLEISGVSIYFNKSVGGTGLGEVRLTPKRAWKNIM